MLAAVAGEPGDEALQRDAVEVGKAQLGGEVAQREGDE